MYRRIQAPRGGNSRTQAHSSTSHLSSPPVVASRDRMPVAILPVKANFAQQALTIVAVFLATRLVICIMVYTSLIKMPIRMMQFPSTHFPSPIVDGLVRWDSFHYANIALHGYDRVKTAFFPLYPLLIKGLMSVCSNVYIAGLVISNAALLVALGYLYALARKMYGQAGATRTILYFTAAPGSVFLSAMYSESLFIALVAATFYHAHSRQWIRAGFVGALAAATRNTGIILAVVVALEGLHNSRLLTLISSRPAANLAGQLRRQAQRIGLASPALAAAAMVPIGLVAYMVYLGLKFHDSLLFIHVETYWHKSIRLSNLLHVLPPGSLNLSTAIDTLVALAFVPLVLVVWRRLRPAFVVFTLATFVLPLDSGGVVGMTRYVLMLVPCYLILGSLGRRTWLDRLVLGLSLPLMCFITITFSHWGGPY